MECLNCHNEIKEKQEVCLSCGHILRYESEESKTCIHCNRRIPIAYKKCPYCKKKQVSKRKTFIKLVVLLLVIFANYKCFQYLNIYNELEMKTNYDKYYDKVSYEELVRRNKYYDEAFIKLTGKVIRVDKVTSLSNIIKITMYVENKDNKVTVYYKNRKSKGFMKNDTIEVYGKYKKIEGNTPRFTAQIIDIKNSK